MNGATGRCIALVAAVLFSVAYPGCVSKPVDDESDPGGRVATIPDGLSFPPLEQGTSIKSEPLPEDFWVPLLKGKKETDRLDAARRTPSTAGSPGQSEPASSSGAGHAADSPGSERDPGKNPEAEPASAARLDGTGSGAGPEPDAPAGRIDAPGARIPAAGGDPPLAPGTARDPSSPSSAPGGSDGRPPSAGDDPPVAGTSDPAAAAGAGGAPGGAETSSAGETSAPPAAAGEERTGFRLWMPAAATPALLSLCLVGLVTVRRNRFRRELMDLFGVEWRGRVPLSQLRGFVQAHRSLNERLKNGLGYIESRHGDVDGVADPDLRRLSYLVRSIDQRRRHILNDIKQLASASKGSETSLEKALRIHAARMELLDANDDLMQGLRHVQAQAKG